jgi:non-specific serine/threonine protein kinase
MRTRGDTERAGAVYEQARALFVSIDPHRKYEPQGLVHNLAYVALARRDVRRAAGLFVEGAETYLAVGPDRRGLAECIVGLGRCAVDASNGPLAARLFGAAEAELERLDARLTSANRAEFERGIGGLHSLIGAQQADHGRAEGRELSLEAALEEARSLIRELSSTHEGRPRTPVELTRREYEVAALVARGRSNRQIADALVITEKTAKNHVARILDKLSVHSRTEIAARAEEFGLR